MRYAIGGGALYHYSISYLIFFPLSPVNSASSLVSWRLQHPKPISANGRTQMCRNRAAHLTFAFRKSRCRVRLVCMCMCACVAWMRHSFCFLCQTDSVCNVRNKSRTGRTAAEQFGNPVREHPTRHSLTRETRRMGKKAADRHLVHLLCRYCVLVLFLTTLSFAFCLFDGTSPEPSKINRRLVRLPPTAKSPQDIQDEVIS